jgi:hypothetical protein
MSNQRSPNCPQISFLDAAEKGRLVYKKEHTRATAKSVIAEDLDYKGISGASLSMIGALRQYGVLEGSKEAMRITQDALAYYELDDGPEKQAAIVRMAFKPPLFQEMKGEFGKSVQSEASMRHWLVKKGFLSKAADDVIRVYKENITLAVEEQEGYSGGEGNASMTTTAPAIHNKPTPGVQTYSFALSPDAKAELSLRGTITPNDLVMLRNHIELTIQALGGPAKKETDEK